MKVRIEYEVTVDDPDETEAAWCALARRLTPKKWTVRDVQFCTRLVEVEREKFKNIRVIRVVAGEAKA